MSNPAAILFRCQELGLKVWADGDRLGVSPTEKIPSGLLEEIRAAKLRLLPLVRDTEAKRLLPDQIPWIHVARQVLDGEFEGVDRSWRASLLIGLRSIPHSLARQAHARLLANSTLP